MGNWEDERLKVEFGSRNLEVGVWNSEVGMRNAENERLGSWEDRKLGSLQSTNST